MSKTTSEFIQIKASPTVHAFYGGRKYGLEALDSFLADTAIPAKQTYLKLKQTHSTRVIALTEMSQIENPVEADGVFTDLPNVALLIKTADCMPLFFWGASRRVIGNVHAGWRGLSEGILERAVELYCEQYQGEAASLQVAIGPSIRPCCYEVESKFEAIFGADYYEKRNETHGRLDLQKKAIDRLVKLGIARSAIDDLGVCTCCHNDYHSYRRNATDQRNLAVICLSPLS